MALVDARGFQLVPDVSPLTQRIGQAIQGRRKIAREDQLKAEKQKVAQVKDDLLRTASHADRIRDIKDPMAKRKEIAVLAQELTKQGKDASMWTDLLNETNPDQLNLGLTRIFTNTGDAGKLFGEALKDDADQFEPVLDDEGNVVAQRNVQTGQVVADPRAVARAKAEGAGGISEVQSSKILPGGVTQIVRKDGTVEVIEPEAVAVEVVKRAEDRGVDLQQKRAQGRGLGKDAAKIASKVFDRAGKLRATNRTLRKVITAVGEGAETGPLTSKMPSMREASIKLDQLRSELGLDVVGAVTFGALSEGELNLAMSTALPTKLEGPALVKWANDKITAQEKLVDYLEDQAIFLSEKGNTPAMWLQEQKSKAIPVEKPVVEPETRVTPTAQQGRIKFLGFE